MSLSHRGRAIVAVSQGLLLTDWGDGGHLQPPVVSFPAFLAASDYAWNARAGEGSPGFRGGGGAEPLRRVTMDQLMARVAAGVDRVLLGGAAAGVGQVLMTHIYVCIYPQVLMTMGQAYAAVGRETVPNRSVLWDLVMLANRRSTLVRRDLVLGRSRYIDIVYRPGPRSVYICMYVYMYICIYIYIY